MLLFCALLILFVTVYSAPQNQDQNSSDRFSSLLLPVAHPKRQAITSFAPYDKSWEKFKTVHRKSYHSIEEETYRRTVFKKNVLVIEEHNKEYNLGKKSYSLGINQFADLEHWEYMQTHGCLFKKTVNQTREGSRYLTPSNVALPDSVNWTAKGYVTPVKDQGQCGSCWSFSATGSLEGQHFKATGKLLPLSEQQLVDCSGAYGNKGCNGGWMDNAFKYIAHVGGVELESNYPYNAKQRKCNFDKSKAVATCTNFTDITSGSETDLQSAVATVGPVSVAIDASNPLFKHYKTGVYDEPGCGSQRPQLTHAVLAVGYGTDSGKDYWLVKNSWGERWGDNGYIKMSRNSNNQCGIATQASYALV